MAEKSSVSLDHEKGNTSKNSNDIKYLPLSTKSKEQTLDNEYLKKALIEEIKGRILKSVNLTEPPESNDSIPFFTKLRQ
ncbi:hypothetical protein TNCV_2355391 [Trichonephila clavipes]|nr:hypothetical protein TNCV_2355391 [Trichonephila clavipes]